MTNDETPPLTMPGITVHSPIMQPGEFPISPCNTELVARLLALRARVVEAIGELGPLIDEAAAALEVEEDCYDEARRGLRALDPVYERLIDIDEMPGIPLRVALSDLADVLKKTSKITPTGATLHLLR